MASASADFPLAVGPATSTGRPGSMVAGSITPLGLAWIAAFGEGLSGRAGSIARPFPRLHPPGICDILRAIQKSSPGEPDDPPRYREGQVRPRDAQDIGRGADGGSGLWPA